MANRDTPLIRNAWYVAARSDEISRKLFARQYLGISTVLFRREDGSPVALQNRCCHRSFPLSEGKLDGDILECGYHGFRYDCSGKCVAVPSQKKPPENIRLRAFPVVEKKPFIWIWPGDPKLADESLLPHQEFFDHPDWAVNIGYLNIKGSYVHLHENLLDLSHLSFLHDKTFGTPEYARAPLELNVDEEHFEAWRHEVRALAAATAVAETGCDLRTALVALVRGDGPADDAPRDGASLIPLLGEAPIARALLRRIVGDWLAAL